jgi:hypothetical protein
VGRQAEEAAHSLDEVRQLLPPPAIRLVVPEVPSKTYVGCCFHGCDHPETCSSYAMATCASPSKSAISMKRDQGFTATRFSREWPSISSTRIAGSGVSGLDQVTPADDGTQ